MSRSARAIVATVRDSCSGSGLGSVGLTGTHASTAGDGEADMTLSLPRASRFEHAQAPRHDAVAALRPEGSPDVARGLCPREQRAVRADDARDVLACLAHELD